MLKQKLQTTFRTVAQAGAAAGLLSAVACGGTMPFSGGINVAGDPPALPPPPKEEPPKPPARVEVRDNKIEIREKIHFEKRKAIIKEESFSLMDEIAQVFTDNPHILKVSIEGHTDSDGSDQYNQGLSDERSASVMKYLTDKGISTDRLEAKGFGEKKPIASNDTDDGKTKNRRVEFHITKQDITKKKVEIDPVTGKERVLSEEPAKTSDAKK